MNTKYIICSVVGGLVLGGAISTSQAAWIAPSGGWQVNYQASSNSTPDASSPAWANVGGYQAANSGADNYSAVVTDSVTSEKTLYLGNTWTSAPGDLRYPRYVLNSGAGAGAYSDKITLDFRFRLLDGLSPEQQWDFAIDRPGDALNTTTHSVNLSFRVNKIQDANTNTQYNATIGTTWHDARLLFDVAGNTASLYLDGSSTAAVTLAGTTFPGLYNDTWFGDGLGQVQGKAEVSYFRWTNNELAAVPEPASMGLLALGGSLLLMKRRRKVA